MNYRRIARETCSFTLTEGRTNKIVDGGQLQEASSRLSFGVAILWLENNGGLAGVFLIVSKINC